MTSAPSQPAYPPPSQASATDNVLGLIGFIGSILGFVTCGILAPIALIISLIGLTKQPRAFAIAGTVISLIGCILLLSIGGMVWAMVVGAMTGWDTVQRAVVIEGSESAIRDAYATNQVAPTDAEGQALIDTHFQASNELFTPPRYRRVSDTVVELVLPGADERVGTADDDVTRVDLTTTPTYETDGMDVEAGTPETGVEAETHTEPGM